VSRECAEALLEGLVAIPSLSGREHQASEWLVDRFRGIGFERAYIDEAGNAVGELGEADAPRVVLLLGHIDTVAGVVPTSRTPSPSGELLYGRGTVDAKGPLCALACGAALLGGSGARDRGIRVVVAGAVEEEAPGSRGARHLARRFDGVREPKPMACVIGEPSRWNRITTGYKGSVVVEVEAEREVSHSAGPERGVACAAVELWLALDGLAASYNSGRERPFEQLLPSLRAIETGTDGLRERARATLAARLPVGYDVELLAARLTQTAESLCGSPAARDGDLREPGSTLEVVASGASLRCVLRFHGYEVAYRAPSGGRLAAAFLASIRSVGERCACAAQDPRFVVKTGTSDMNVVAPVFGCPILAYGPGDSTLDHTPHEHVELDEYWRAVQVVAGALTRL
jgi:LysW-gamma-L-lysine carboxypeptidase